MTIIRHHHFLLTLIYLLFFLALGISYSQSPQIQQAIADGTTQVVYQGQKQWAKWTGQKAPTKPAAIANQTSSNNNSDSPQTSANTSSSDLATKSNGGGRWRQNHATVYLAVTNPTLRQATKEAISNWNKTGAFHFIQTNHKKKANIVVHQSDREDGAAGLTESSLWTNGYFVKVSVFLNANYLLNPTYNYSHERIVNTAEHELGHAMGLEHTNSVSVMQPAGSMYSIQPSDIQAVKYIYSHAPNMNNNNANGAANSSSGINNGNNNNNDPANNSQNNGQ